MTSSDANAISAVVVRDILPALRGGRPRMSGIAQLLAGRICTFVLLVLSMIIAYYADHFGGVLGLIILWFAALTGPIAVPLLLGMLLPFRRCGPAAALIAWSGGVLTFIVIKFVLSAQITNFAGNTATAVDVGSPVAVTFLLYIVVGLFTRKTRPPAYALLNSINLNSFADEDLAYDIQNHNKTPQVLTS
jgi:solute:Na+ symporter, SSS family